MYNRCVSNSNLLLPSGPCFVELDLGILDPNKRYKFKDPDNIQRFINAVFEMNADLKKLDLHDIPLELMAQVDSVKKIVDQYKVWLDDIDLLYSIALREHYMKQIRGNIRIITTSINRILAKNFYGRITENVAYHLLCSTLLDNRAIQQNESIIKNYINGRPTSRSVLDIATLYEQLRKDEVIEDLPGGFNSGDRSYEEDPQSDNVNESSNFYDDRDLDYIKYTKIKSISPAETTLNQGAIKYDSKGKCIVAISNFDKGDIIEVAPVKVMGAHEFDILNSYMPNKNIYFEIISGKVWGLPLGYVPIYQYTKSKSSANAYFRYSASESVIRIIETKDIAKGEDIVVLLQS